MFVIAYITNDKDEKLFLTEKGWGKEKDAIWFNTEEILAEHIEYHYPNIKHYSMKYVTF